jgi:hypothetical protein
LSSFDVACSLKEEHDHCTRISAPIIVILGAHCQIRHAITVNVSNCRNRDPEFVTCIKSVKGIEVTVQGRQFLGIFSSSISKARRSCRAPTIKQSAGHFFTHHKSRSKGY